MDIKKLKAFLIPGRDRLKLYCKAYIYISTFLIILWSSIWTYIFIGEGKDGEYCQYTDNMDNYHILVDGEPCLLQWTILIEFLTLSIYFIVPAQLPVWITLFLLKRKKKNTTRRKSIGN